jgi:hypothetical protein
MVNMYLIQQALSNVWYSLVINLPYFLWALMALLFGFLAGRFGGWLVKQFLMKIKLDQFIFERDKFKMKLSDIFSVMTRWIIYLLFLMYAVSFLGVPEITQLIASAISFLTGAVEAAVIIIVGYSLATYIKEQVMHTKTFYADVVGNIILFLITYVSISIALSLIGINTELINWILIVIVASFGIGMAIAIGLGLKDVVRDAARQYTRNIARKRR